MNEITEEEARNVLHYFGHPQGWEPGSFTSALLLAIGKADLGNRALLGLGFPGLVAAMGLAQHAVGGIDRLLAIAEGKA